MLRAVTARKSTKKAAAGKKTPARKSTASKSTAKAASPKPASGAPKAPARKKAASKPKGKFTSLNVNLGHIFALRPRVTTSFPQAHFRTARHLLQDESYASMGEAARAVVDKALELTREGPSKRGFKPGQR